MKTYSYLYYCRPDGIGFQYTAISRCLYIARQLELVVLVDWRRWSFLHHRDQAFALARLHEVFSIRHPGMIYDPREIDRIITENPEKVVGIRGDRLKGAPHDTARELEFLTATELYPEHDKKMDCLDAYLHLEGDFKRRFDQFKPLASGCVGIHARLGNGEEFNNPLMRQRMDIPLELYFREMDRLEDKTFLVCSDTPSFVQACTARYNGRVKTIPRTTLPENCGPGHRPGAGQTDTDYDGYTLLGEALLEMLLLGECESLICNASLFTMHARKCRQVPSVVLTNETGVYALP